jgi:hypothetical protein
LQSAYEERENSKSNNEKYFGSCNWITIDSWHWEEGGHCHMSETARTHANEDCQQDYKYSIFHKNLTKYEQKHMTLLIRRS